jgi:predicted protein tyrosine phosphatase
MIKLVLAKSKSSVETILFKDNDFVISITNPSDNIAVLSIKESNILRFSFSDIMPSNKKNYPHHFENEKSFHIDDAKVIVAKIIELANDTKEWNLIIHCVLGVSRSGAIATFALSHSDMKDYDFAACNSNIKPNDWVYQLLCFVEENKLYK